MPNAIHQQQTLVKENKTRKIEAVNVNNDKIGYI